MLALGETTKYGLLTACMALAAAATGPLPHEIVAGLLLLVSGACALWMLTPGALSDAYKHMTLNMRGQWRFLLHLR